MTVRTRVAMSAFDSLPATLLERARKGRLTRRNTTPGTPERRAVDRVAYLRRRARHPELTARQATGHHVAPLHPPRISLMVDDPVRFLVLDGLSRRQLSRAGRYADLVSKLDDGRISSKDFRRRVRRWRSIEGFAFLSDPDAVLALLEQRRANDYEIFVYDSGRSA